ncbi:MAG: hypothetical protein M1820_007360 [Bogoriella megaspora]|nr:MAG: hypothetical protein M1820_007360 [Bogoriella megaspora]
MVDAGYAADVRFATTSCNCLGFLGSALGGGQARTMGLYGMSVDQLISMNVVTAWGALIAVDPSNDDLWWALKGAAPNFGIVTSATVKAYAVPQAQNVVWTGTIVFADDRLEEFISIINDLYLQPEMQIHFLFSSAANGSTSITAIPFYIGSTAEGRQAFKSILDIGYISDTTAELPYPQWNEVADPFCSRGGRKPGYGVSMNNLDPQEWRSVYEDFKGLIKRYPFARKSIILAENYPVNSTAVQNGAGSYPFRSVKTHAVALPWYANASFDSTANQWGEQVRSALRSTDGLQHNANYINFAHGDETLKDIYGESLPRLQALKKQYDPLNRFNQWFPIV